MRRIICVLGSLILLALSSASADGGPFRNRLRPVVVTYPAPVATAKPVPITTTAATGSALDEVNATRAARRLPPFKFDANLTLAAEGCAKYRAANLIEGHTRNDFAYLPAGVFAPAAGCAAWPPQYGWGACCTYENWTYAGAAIVIGRDGKRYMHIFVR